LRVSYLTTLTEATEEVIHDILRAAPRARVALKRLVDARYGAVDKITFDESVNADEVVEGFRAFVEKRTPDWAPAEGGRGGGFGRRAGTSNRDDFGRRRVMERPGHRRGVGERIGQLAPNRRPSAR